MYLKKLLKNSFILFISGIFFANGFISCTNGINENDEKNKPDSSLNSTESEQKVGYLTINFGNDFLLDYDSSRQAVSLEDVAALVNCYELLIFNETELQKIPFAIDDTKISVPVGTWNLVVLAGTKKYALVGSGYYNNLTIEENKVSEVSVNLYPVDISMTASQEQVFCNQTFTVEVSVDMRNPYLLADYVYLNGSKLELIPEEDSSVSSASREITASSVPGSLEIKYTTSNFNFVPENLKEAFANTSDFKTIINSSVYEKDNMTVKICNVQKQEVNTGIVMSLNWLE